MLIYYHVIMVKINMKETFKEKIQKLLDTKMDRKDFLKYTAATGLMAMGGGVILKSADHLDILPVATVLMYMAAASHHLQYQDNSNQEYSNNHPPSHALA